ncbi:aldehyde dehydrogenase family protein [Shewanella surugensis]|uniref:Aldehyde dehydrogenase n=1 Tax=Shewanella surugensis TaxID=212020 RepID=A0ABT0LHM5_9GAMM|nr:aldehyde dehydrogenase family protein [Shewanella surugensis]MCL1127216.1 aldehyde dehydrogenase family protein [Shewanella surugensis]
MNATMAHNKAAMSTIDTLTRVNVTETSQAQLEQQVQAARLAQYRLAKSSVKQRLAAIRDVRNALFTGREAIIEQICLETGKCRTDAQLAEIMGVVDYADWLCAKGAGILADTKVATPISLLGKKSLVSHCPLGIVAVISPWNYPFHISFTTVLAALAAGNSVLLKPSEVTPLMGVVEDLLMAAPLFYDCVQVLYGSGDTAQRMIAMKPNKVMFTGSASTGKKILAQAAPLLIPVELELGGKDAMLVFEDVDLSRTVAGCLWGGLTNAGQSCTSVESVYIHASIYAAFVDKLKAELARLVQNNGDQGDADLGAITADFQRSIIDEQVKEAQALGADVFTANDIAHQAVIAKGEQSSQPVSPKSVSELAFYPPTLIEGASDDMSVMHSETFGPVMTLHAFDDERELIERCNASEFGLSASVWSKDLTRAKRVAKQLEVGAVSINNVMLTEGNPNLPFGGTKQSGFGRVKGSEGLLGMTYSKAILIDKQSKNIEANWYPYTRQKYQLFDKLMMAMYGTGLKRWLDFAKVGLKLESFSQKKRGE